MAPRKPWERPTTYNVYIDESSQTKLHYLVLGGLVVPKPFAANFETAIVEARGPRYPAVGADGRQHAMKWERAKSRNDLVAYKRVIDTFWQYPTKSRMPVGMDLNIHCVAVDMTKRDNRKYSFGNADIGFSKDLNCLAVSIIGRQYRLAKFHLYPDRRTTNQSLMTGLNIMNNTCAQYEDENRFSPFEKMDWAECEDLQALQIVDIVIGALAYKLNGHYDKPEANKTKKALCEHILARAKICDVAKNTSFMQRRITLFHRNFSAFSRRKR